MIDPRRDIYLIYIEENPKPLRVSRAEIEDFDKFDAAMKRHTGRGLPPASRARWHEVYPLVMASAQAPTDEEIFLSAFDDGWRD
jgi:hypothetical protein